ncbi:MAG: hypothetical protein HY854_24175 [Burkholderiales bacterium]|nr:hypothetical protein [Burkholderiales bacterium]
MSSSQWKLHAAVLSAGAMLAGCVGIGAVLGPPVRAYGGPEKPDFELAELVASRELASPMYANLVSVDGTLYGDGIRGFPITVKVAPGEHRVGITCGNAPDYRYPALTGIFKAGHVYEFRCRDAGNGVMAAALVDHGETYQAPAPKEKE